MGFSKVRGPRQKDFGLEGCGRRMSDTWSSEIQKYAYGVMFQSLVFQRLGKLKNTKRVRPNITFRPQIAASSIAELVVWAAESAMAQIRWLRVWLLWVLIRIPTAWRVLARIYRVWFSNCARIWEFVGFGSSWKWYSILVQVASILNFVGSWIFIEAWYVAIGFLGGKRRHTELKEIDFIDTRSLQGKPIL